MNEVRQVITLLVLTGIASPSVSLAQTPIPRQGDSCPSGTYRSGDYCQPFQSTIDRGEVIIQKSGKDCPTGFYSAGAYCKRIGTSDREAIPRESGDKCPRGWRKSGDYCVKS